MPSKNGLLTTIGWRIDGKTTYCLEGAVFIAGAAVQWVRDGLKAIQSSAEVERLAATVDDAGGVYVVPAFVGLGAPYWDPYARGLIIGLTRDTGIGHIARATVDSMAYQTREVLELMQQEAGLQLSGLKVDGGAAANDALLQFQADLLGATVRRPIVAETTALGAAYLAGLAVGYWDGPEDVTRNWALDRTFEPQMPTETSGSSVCGLEEGRRTIPGLGWPMNALAGLCAVAILLQGPASSSVQAAPGVLILHKKASSLGLYDSNTGQRRWVAPVGAKPHEMVLSQGNRYAYVTDYGVDTYTSPEEGGKTISIVDLNMGRRIGTIDLGTFRRPHGIVLGLSGRAYVTVDHPAAVIEVDTDARRVAAQHLLDQKLPHMVAVSPDERFLYSANAGSGTVSIIDRRAGGTVRTLEVGGVPMGLALDRQGRRLFVATRDANVVAVIDCDDQRIVRADSRRRQPRARPAVARRSHPRCDADRVWASWSCSTQARDARGRPAARSAPARKA